MDGVQDESIVGVIDGIFDGLGDDGEDGTGLLWPDIVLGGRGDGLVEGIPDRVLVGANDGKYDESIGEDGDRDFLSTGSMEESKKEFIC